MEVDKGLPSCADGFVGRLSGMLLAVRDAGAGLGGALEVAAEELLTNGFSA